MSSLCVLLGRVLTDTALGPSLSHFELKRQIAIAILRVLIVISTPPEE